MNVWGKVFAFLVVIAAIAASVFTAKLVQIRNSYTAKSLASKNKFDDLKPKIAALETQIESLQNEIFRAQQLWQIIVGPSLPTTVNPADGSVQVNAGSDVGIRPNLLLHGFEITADGTSIYRGPFLPVDIQNAVTTLKPDWRVNANDVRSWASGNWRWRSVIPPGYGENFDKQLTAILKLEETLNDRMRTLAAQKDVLADAKAKLKLREAELVGGEELAKGNNAVGPEYRDGLVAAVAQEVEERNQTLVTLDELRRKEIAVQDDIERLLQENVELTSRLPQPTPKNQVTQATK
jgi:hypothetical protein